MLSFDEFKETRERKTPAEAAKAIGVDAEMFADGIAILIYDECLYIEEGPDGWFYCLIERSHYRGTREQMESLLYLEWYVSECPDEYTLDGLSDLLREWCKWNDQTVASADEILHDILHIEPEARTSVDRRRIVWLEWFIRTWEPLEEAATAGPYA